jgi:DNA-binding PadR family transcriptional regulator
MSSRLTQPLTSTSYAILGMLATRPWSTYALAKQMRRSLHHIWPRAESNIYAEPKRLVELGLAKAEVQTLGKRSRTVYAITHDGRDAFERWLGTQSSPSRFESETLVKVLFGNLGTKEELLANLGAFAQEAAATKQLLRQIAADYASGTSAFPERTHINSLIFLWIWEHADTQARWAEAAMAQVRRWPDTRQPPAETEAALDVFRSALASAAETPVEEQPRTRAPTA